MSDIRKKIKELMNSAGLKEKCDLQDNLLSLEYYKKNKPIRDNKFLLETPKNKSISVNQSINSLTLPTSSKYYIPTCEINIQPNEKRKSKFFRKISELNQSLSNYKESYVNRPQVIGPKSCLDSYNKYTIFSATDKKQYFRKTSIRQGINNKNHSSVIQSKFF